MIKFIDNLPKDVIGIELEGDVTKDEYEITVMPRIDDLAKQQGELNYFVVIKTDISNLGIGVWWDDFKMAIKHFNKWNKIAIVSDHDIIKKLANIFGFAYPGESRGFKLDQFDEAYKWITS